MVWVPNKFVLYLAHWQSSSSLKKNSAMGSILVIYTKNWTYCIYSNAKYKDIINMHFAIRSLLFHQSCKIVSTRMVNVTGLNQSHFFLSLLCVFCTWSNSMLVLWTRLKSNIIETCQLDYMHTCGQMNKHWRTTLLKSCPFLL